MSGQESGSDPTASWRAAAHADLVRQHGASVPASVSATFVMQWYVGALATAAAHLAAAAPFVVELEPAAQSIALSGPGGYPVAVGITDAAIAPEDDLERRISLAEQGFRAHARTFAATYEPGVKMSSQHRAGSIKDAWASAEGAALRAVTGLAPAARWRESCCFIYPLPGVHECARCPRLRTIGTT